MHRTLVGLALLATGCSGDGTSGGETSTGATESGTSTGSGTSATSTSSGGCDTECECQTDDDCDQSFASHSCIDGKCECFAGCCDPASCPGTTGDSTSTGTSTSTGGGAGIVLDPRTLEIFDLPIGSIRYAIAGQDLASDTCVTLVWSFGQSGDQWNQTCAGANMVDWPYVIVTPDTTAPCMEWEYGPNVTTDDATGCVQFQDTQPVTATVDTTVTVSGAAYTGTISVTAP